MRMSLFQIRTDLALEMQENMEELHHSVHGVTVEESNMLSEEMKITRVTIESKNGAKAMGKPMGMYVTIEAPRLAEIDSGYHKDISDKIAVEIKNIIPECREDASVLVVGLGNREVTADSLGPHVVDHLQINRHMVLEYGQTADIGRQKKHIISAFAPGVMARTGMETAEIIKGVIEQTAPDFMIVVDALAARSLKRLNRTIQLSNTGIQPGSGVGNHRHALTLESLGIPVIAIGVPTVVDAGTIVEDSLTRFMKEAGCSFQMLSGAAKPGMLSELNAMYVTSKDVDSQIQQIAHVLCDAINLAL